MNSINNLPAYASASDIAAVVAREVDGNLWFYGAYTTVEKARQAAEMVGGNLIQNPGYRG